MNVLISGARGYIGRRLVEHLKGHGVEVSILIRDTGTSNSFFKQFTTYVHDITSEETIKFSKNYDFFIHLAAANDIDSKNSKKALEGTTLGTKNCLELARINGIKNFIYFSTFQVYGQAEGVINEETPLRPVNDYAITHFFAEEYVKMFSRNFGMDYAILRPVNIYGAPESRSQKRWSLVPSCFCLEAFESGKITLKTSGKQLKDFIGLDQLSEWTLELMNSFANYKNQSVNFSSEEAVTVKYMADKVAEIYRNKFNKACILDVQSEEPRESGTLLIENKRLKNGMKFKTIKNLDKEIEKIFSMLEKGESCGSN